MSDSDLGTSPPSLVFDAEYSDRVDKIVGEHYPEASRKRLAQLFAERLVRVDGKKVKKGHMVQPGQRIALDRAPISDDEMRAVPESGPLQIVYEDEHLVALVKEPGMPTYPLKAAETGTLANAVVATYPECATIGKDPRESGFAHRLDADTSGLLILARTQECWLALRNAFASGNVQKSYLAVVEGRPIGKECEEELLQDGKRVRVDYAGLEAYTTWEELQRTDEYTLLSCQAHTGRMHQVRAHLSHCGSPIAGDKLYDGTEQEGLDGHFLHGSELHLTHPITGEPLSLSAQLPEERAKWLATKGLRLPTASSADEN
ncbi:MAG: RluA family pseudouridine synthase [Myxococcales bacterium]|nr:RluA family pseudouridine synthase [Myxococcales bacterium]